MELEDKLERYKTLDYSGTQRIKLRLGADVDAWCTRCRMLLTHTLLALDKGEPSEVMCNTCKSKHKYRLPSDTERNISRRKVGAPPAKPKGAKMWEEASRGKDLSHPIAYHPAHTFAAGDVLIHGTFGVGVVMGIKEGGKIIVAFQDDMHLLVHGR
jgi:hypothetical protein